MSNTQADSCWISRSPEATHALAVALAGVVDARGAAIALVGELGCGKTVFAKGLAAGLGIDPAAVASPTFTIAGEYSGAGGMRLVHADLYRVESEAELLAAGFDDWLESGTLLAVEWGDRFPGLLPPDRLEISFARGLALAAQVGDDSAPAASVGVAGDAVRSLRARALGPLAVDRLARWVGAAVAVSGVELQGASR